MNSNPNPENLQERMFRAWNAIFWAILTVFFGLLHIWLAFAMGIIRKDIPFNYDEFTVSGGLLFFASAITTSLRVDHFFSVRHASGAQKNVSSIFEYLYMSNLFPFTIIFTSVLTFVILYSAKPENLELGIIFAAELAVVTMAIVYAILIKYCEFEKRHDLKLVEK